MLEKNFYPKNEHGNIAAVYNEVQDEAQRPVFPVLKKDIQEEGRNVIAVIGSGFVGLSAALALAQQAKDDGLKIRVVLMERDRVGSGPSGKSSGHVHGLFQAHGEEVEALCGEELGQRLMDELSVAPLLVRELIAKHNIPCDVREGYGLFDKENRLSFIPKEDEPYAFGVSPYPLVLGLAKAAHELGVEIYEKSPVTEVKQEGNKCVVTTTEGKVEASYVVGAGGRMMAKTIPALSSFGDPTFDMYVTTVITPVLPPDVLIKTLDGLAERKSHSCDLMRDVTYINVTQEGAIVLGCRADSRKTDVAKIEDRIHEIFPGLRADYEAATGKDMVCKPYVQDEKLSFTPEIMPVVMADGRVFGVEGLGGAGIGAGIFLGRAMAQNIVGLLTKRPDLGETFRLFAHIRHLSIGGNVPLFRRAAAEVVKIFLRNPILDEAAMRVFPGIRNWMLKSGIEKKVLRPLCKLAKRYLSYGK